MIEDGLYVRASSTLEAAMPIFERADIPYVPVVMRADADASPVYLGALFHVDALKAYNRALAATAAEEHS